MIVFISDLHLMDATLDRRQRGGSIGQRHLSFEAFRGTFKDIARCARDAEAKKVRIVFLGDTFDMLSTGKWFDFPNGARPWDSWINPGPDSEPCQVLEGIMNTKINQRILGFISSEAEMRKVGFRDIAVDRVFVPGNHDRLCNLPALRDLVCRKMGIGTGPDGKPLVLNEFFDAEHRVFARHGHEWDRFNFEESRHFSHLKMTSPTADDYLKPPIGDVLTLEIASRLPGLVMERLPKKCSCDKWELWNRMCAIFDVRPKAAMIPWMSYQVGHYGDDVKEAVNKAVKQAAVDLQNHEFVKQWMARHDSLLNPFDDASLLHYLAEYVERAGIHLTTQLAIGEKVAAWFTGDNLASRAADEFARLDTARDERKNTLYVLYGHTHEPEQRAIETTPARQDRVYLNTGTWRPIHEQGLTKRGFASWHGLTYTIVYNCQEKVSGDKTINYPAFEVWTGGLKNF